MHPTKLPHGLSTSTATLARHSLVRIVSVCNEFAMLQQRVDKLFDSFDVLTARIHRQGLRHVKPGIYAVEAGTLLRSAECGLCLQAVRLG
jgi:hypothetical protein